MIAPAFWYRPPGLLAYILLPAAALYRAGSWIRRTIAHPFKPTIPVICVGNIVTGGAGKTPTAITLAAMLKAKGHQPVFVMRGYGGSERGPMAVDLNIHGARDVGDEALVLARHAPVFIGSNRAATIALAQSHGSHIILDDGLQNPTLAPDLAFLVMDGATGLGNGCILPAGPLRENFTAALSRVAAIIVVGEQKASLPPGDKPILHAALEPVLDGLPRDTSYVAFAGIGRPEKFFDTCHKAGLTLAGREAFPDHHPYSAGDIRKLKQLAQQQNAQLLTTEKDWVRLPPDMQAITYVLPVKLVFKNPAQIESLLP